ncbi:DUF2065 family protein [Aliiroseovarius crassostreae]|uniref:DUF2065 family protein n=1 Tax=Aliiroseovarius crassostreae TaxID=154981 RepID=UPI003C7A354C
MSLVLLGFGLVLVIEGLVFALAPSRLDELLAAINALSRDHRRVLGLGAVAIGAVMVWLSQG